MTEIQVDGLAETERFLSRLPGIVEDAAGEAGAAVADSEVPRVRARAGSVSRQAALAARSVRAEGDGIVGGAGGGVPAAIFFGAEFGGGGRARTRQFEPHRGTEGYFLFPQLRDDDARIVEEYDQALDPISAEWGR